MNKSFLVRMIGFPASLIHGDTLTVDRWLWLAKRLPRVSGQALIDVGCGTGAFTIGAARRGYHSLGLSWDARNQTVAQERAAYCGTKNARFEILDVRKLGERPDLIGKFDVAILCEVIEHVLDDQKLISDTARLLKPGGQLLLTTPYLHFRPIRGEDKEVSTVEDGGHVRLGYTEARLRELAAGAGLVFDESSYCSGLLSQKLTWLLRTLSAVNYLLGWAVVLPLRVLPPILDPVLGRLTRWPFYSICMECHLPVRAVER